MIDVNDSEGSATHDAALLVTKDRWLLRTLSVSMHASRYSLVDARSMADARLAHAECGPGALAFVDIALDDTQPGTLVDLVLALRRGGWANVMTVGDRTCPGRVVGALAAGADGHLVAGEPCHSGLGGELPASALPSAAQPGREAGTGRLRLSTREEQVVTLAARGYPNREIAHALGISTDTVKNHLARMNRNTGARNRAHLVLLMMRNGAIS